MQIRNNTPQTFNNTPSFKNKEYEYLKKMTQVIPNTKVSKGLTQLDRNYFQDYIYSAKFKLGTTVQEFQKLCKLEDGNFIYGAYELLTKKMGIPKEIRPELKYLKQSECFDMCYNPQHNIITIDPDIHFCEKSEIFNLLRHELQHFRQNMDIYRHEKLGEKAIDFHVKSLIEKQKIIYKDLLNNMTPEEMLQNGFIHESSYNIIAKCKEHLENNDMQAFDKEIEALAPIYEQGLINFREKIINTMGIIKDGTEEAKRAEKYFNDFQKLNYVEPNGEVNMDKYFSTGIEREAIQAGNRAEFEVSGEGCMFKYFKNKSKKFMNEHETYEGVKYLEEQEIMAKQAKEASDKRNQEWVDKQREKELKEKEAYYTQVFNDSFRLKYIQAKSKVKKFFNNLFE